MSSLLRSAAVLTVLAVTQLGCAGRLRADGNAHMASNGGFSCGGGLSGSGTARASGSGYGSGQAGGYASGQSSGGAHGQGSATTAGTGSWGGGAYTGGGAYAGAGASTSPCGCATPAGAGASGGGATATAGGGTMLPLPGIPQFYGIPLGGADDVVFVLDRSDSMSGSATGAPTSPIAAFASVGYGAMSAFQGTTSSLTTMPTSLSGALAAFSAPLKLGVAPQAVSTSKLDAAKAELVSALSTLPDGTRFGVVFFNENVALLAPGLTSMAPSSRWTSVSFVHGIAPSGTTAAVPALREAYAARPRRVVFLSDGLANTGGDSAQLLAEARAAMRYGVRFDTVGVGADQDAPTLRAMAAESGGIAVSR